MPAAPPVIAEEIPPPTLSKEEATKMLESVKAREKVITQKWHDKTKEVYEIYEGAKEDSTPFNILYSNTEILVPNLFSAAPKPIVRKRFGEMRADDASRASERMAEYCMDTNLSGYPDFVEAIESVVLDAALPGQGQARIRLVEGTACIDYVQPQDFIWAFAKRWEDTPWIAYCHDKTKEDLVELFKIDPEAAAKINFGKDKSSSNEDKGPDTARVYEVWNKATRCVYFLCDAVEDIVLQGLHDPLELKGFFPSGKPLRLLSTPCSTMPRPMYGLYKRQAEELNAITERIKRITQAIRVRGIYDGSIPEIAQIFGSDNLENALVPSNNPSGMARDGGLDKHIWLVPVEKLVMVLNELFKAREQVKSTIYEILGIGDILRGVSAASETASAQQIKDKWGSLRIKKSREKVSAFVRTQIRFLIEVSAKHVDEKVWAKVTGLNLMPTLQATLMPPMPGQPAPPSWGSVLQMLKDDLTRSYVIDIESNSTVDGDATEDKADATEFMTAFGQAMNGLGPLAEQGEEGFEASKALLTEICKRYRMGSELQSLIMKIKPQPKGPTPEQQQAQQEIDKRTQAAEQSETQAKSALDQVNQQFQQQKDQIAQLTEAMRNQKESLEKRSLELTGKAQELDAIQAQLDLRSSTLDLQAREAELSLGKQGVELAVREAQHKVSETIQTATSQHAEKSLTHQKRVLDDRAAQTEAESMAKEETDESSAVDAVLAAVQEQSKLFQAILEKMSKPMKITKTGPGTFERTI